MGEDISKIGAPLWVAIFFAGLVFGGSVAYAGYEHIRIPALESRLQLSEESLKTALEKVTEARRVSEEWKVRSIASLSGSASSTEAHELKNELQKYIQWNREWKTEYDKVAAEKNYWQSRANLTAHIKDMEERRTAASSRVTAWVGGECNGQPNCDLNLLAARKLKALEQERDQLHAQVLDLQTQFSK